MQALEEQDQIIYITSSKDNKLQDLVMMKLEIISER
jgi:hypothetical protein